MTGLPSDRFPSPEEFDRPVDEFEMHARTWRAEHRIAEGAAGFCRRLGLDPELAERLHEAAVEDASYRDTIEALCAIQHAFSERLEEDPELAARLRAAIKQDPSLGEGLVRFFAGVIQAMENLEQRSYEEDDEEEDED